MRSFVRRSLPSLPSDAKIRPPLSPVLSSFTILEVTFIYREKKIRESKSRLQNLQTVVARFILYK